MQETPRDMVLTPALIPASGRSPGVRNGNPPQYSCLENSMNRDAWQATAYGVTKNQAWLSTSTMIWSCGSFSSVLIGWITLFGWVLSQLYIPRITFTWSWYIILIIYCWIWFANSLVRISASIFMMGSESESHSVVSDSLDSLDSVHGILQARILEWVAFSFSRRSSQPRDQTQVSGITGRFFTSWDTREPKTTGMSSLSLLQGIFPIQESTRDLLHCRQILYQLNYEGSPWLRISSSGCSVGRESACSAGDPDLIPGSGRFPGEGNGKLFQCPCLENIMDRGAWWVALLEITKSRAVLSE